MSLRAWTYIWGVLIATALLMVSALATIPTSLEQWEIAAVLMVLATLAQLFKVEAPNNQTYYATTIFLFAGVLLLDPALFALVVIVSYLVEWIKERVVGSPLLRQWYLQPFNICTHILAGFAAGGVYAYFGGNSRDFLSIDVLFGVAASAVTYVAVNHVMIGLALVLARGVSWKESGILDTETLATELILLFMGAVTAVLWTVNPWLIVTALSPLVLVYKALMIPQLKRDAQTDVKTGLLNARHFTALFTAEMERARRFGRPVSLIMADLDLLRNINNTYGHMAGDRVLAEIGRVIKETIRDFDIAGRFGGEEFAIVLPEVDLTEARIVGERLREAVEAATVTVGTSSTPLTVTMSLGIASISPSALEVSQLLHEADVAVYQAKLRGRNRVVCITEVPHSIRFGTGDAAARLSSPYVQEYVPRPTAPQTAPPATQPQNHTSESGTHAVHVATLEPAEAAASTHGTAAVSSPEAAPAPAPASPQTGPIGVSSAVGRARFLPWFVATVIAMGVAAVITDMALRLNTGILIFSQSDLAILGVLVVLAMLAEHFQITLFGPDTLSVSMALNFAAAPIAGVPGVAVVSLAIALTHYVKRKPPLYKTAFNWSTHLLAGLAPVFILSVPRSEEYIQKIGVLAVAVPASSAAYFIIETGLLATAIALASGANPVALWKERLQWLASHYMALGVVGLFLSIAYFTMGTVGIVAFLVPIAMMRYTQKLYVDRTDSSVRELQRMNEELTNANREVVAANQAMKELNEELFLTLSKIIDARDPYVSGHAAKVADYAVAIGRELGVEEERIEPLRQAGFLHDIGKIAISEQVLHKPDKLTVEEYEYIKTHAALGAEFLETCRGLRHIAPFVRHHHERWDGAGYPDGIKEKDIPLEARILAVCDAAEAMASDRPYRKGMSLDEMLVEIKRCAGTQFDPSVATAFVKVVERERERLVTNSAHEVLKKYPETGIFAQIKASVRSEGKAATSPAESPVSAQVA